MSDAADHVVAFSKHLQQQVRQQIRAQKRRSLMMLLGLLTFTEFLESQMFIFASSHIIGGVDAGPREFAQVQTAYAVGIMLMVVLQQWLSRRMGYRRYLLASLLLFIVGGVACAWSDHLWSLTLSRLLQGFGGGAFFTSSRILINLMFSVEERPRAIKYFMLIMMASGGVAPVLASHLIEYGEWRWVFYGPLPFALWCAGLIWWLLPKGIGRRRDVPALSMLPLVLFATAVLILQWVLTVTRFDVFTHPLRLWGLLLLGAGLLLGFLWQQWRHPEPLIHLRELNSPVYLTGLGLYFLYYFVASFGNYIFPIYAEQGLGFSLLNVGWMNGLVGLSGVVVGYLYVAWLGRYFPRKKVVMVAGAVALAIAAWWFSRVGADAGFAQLWVGLVAKGVFGVLLVLPVAGLTFSQLDSDDRFAHGYQGKNLMRQIAVSSSTAIAAVMLQNRVSSVDAQLRAGLTPDRTGVLNWLDQTRLMLMQQGLETVQAQQVAMGMLAQRVHQQAQLLAAEQMYEVLAVLALMVAGVIMIQRQLR
jgi:DHA2 family multidrug resistance protein